MTHPFVEWDALSRASASAHERPAPQLDCSWSMLEKTLLEQNGTKPKDEVKAALLGPPPTRPGLRPAADQHSAFRGIHR